MAEQNKHRSKKRLFASYALLAIVSAVVIYLLRENADLKNRLGESTQKRTFFEEQQSQYEQWLKIDSSLIDGDYQAALQAYNKELKEESGNDSVRLSLRIAMANQLFKYRTAYNTIQARDTLLTDSLAQASLIVASETQNFDQASFQLEKAKTQLVQMQRQLREKSAGQYLQFKSSKDHLLNYVGEVKDDKANGYGVAIFDTGSRYEGDWVDNLRHGQGKFYWPDGQYYEGAYADDTRSGQGTYYWPNGERYTGTWKADKRNGQGTFYDSKGEIMTKGIWEDDKLVSEKK